MQDHSVGIQKKYMFRVSHSSATFLCFSAERTTSDNTPSSSLPLLFLIPAALILIPAVVWVCCQWKQHRRRNHPPTHSQHDPVIIAETRHHNNNPVHEHQSNRNSFKYMPVSTTGHCVLNDCQRNCNHTQYV
jgi:hypothetical protein